MTTDTDPQTLSRLLGGIYDCAIDTSGWSVVLGEVCDLLDTRIAELSVFNPLSGAMKIAASHNYPDGLAERALANMAINPIAPLALVQPIGEPLCGSRAYPMDAFRRSLYWHRVVAGYDLYDNISTVFSRNVVDVGFWGTTGSEKRGLFNDDDVAFARLITPHIARSIRISGLLQDKAATDGTLRMVLDALASPAYILAPDGTVRYRNAGSEAARMRDILSVTPGHRLTSSDGEVARFLASLAKEELAGQRGRDLLVGSSGTLLQFTAVRLDKAQQETDGPWLLIVRSPDAELHTPIAIAARTYGLTPAETQVLATIVNGATLQEASERLGVGRATVKTHLDSIYGKSGIRRQADLVRHVTSLISPIG